MRKIIVGLDGSEIADSALVFALDLGRQMKAVLGLVYVVQPTFVAPDASGMDLMWIDGLRKTGTELLLGVAERVRAAGLSCETELQFGSPADALAKVAKAQGADLIVTGSHGYGALTRALIGSVASRLVNISETPVLVVKRART